jgi:hypothetical protein
MDELSSQRRGAIGVIMLLRQFIEGMGFQVYLPFVDDKGVDLVIRMQEGNKIKHLDIQVKYSKRNDKNRRLYFFEGR